MDFDLFLSPPRWKILEVIAKKPSSPLEISQKLGTSVAYVSQQIKLLGAAGVIKKEKTGLVEKGKPRNLFSLAAEILPLTILMTGLPAKKLIKLTDYHKLILRIWLLEDPDLHYVVEKFYWEIEGELKDVDGIFIDTSSKKLELFVLSESKKLKVKIDSFSKANDKLDFSLISNSDLKRLTLENLHPIYDPKFLILGDKMKGGK